MGGSGGLLRDCLLISKTKSPPVSLPSPGISFYYCPRGPPVRRQRVVTRLVCLETWGSETVDVSGAWNPIVDGIVPDLV